MAMHDDAEYAHREGDTLEPREGETGRDQFYRAKVDLEIIIAVLESALRKRSRLSKDHENTKEIRGVCAYSLIEATGLELTGDRYRHPSATDLEGDRLFPSRSLDQW